MKRREFIASTLALTAFPVSAAFNASEKTVGLSLQWDEFCSQMFALADTVDEHDFKNSRAVADRGMELLRQLDISSSGLQGAIENAYESGNEFWLWNRLIKEQKINAGILTVSRKPVPLHDHPDAIGMLRILSGTVDIRQYDRIGGISPDNTTLTLKHKQRLHEGDVAVLTPEIGNIHTLESVSDTCSMLDLFIPPYKKRDRHWYQPLDSNWRNKSTFSCKAIHENEFQSS